MTVMSDKADRVLTVLRGFGRGGDPRLLGLAPVDILDSVT